MKFIETLINISEAARNELVDTGKQPVAEVKEAYAKVVNIVTDLREERKRLAKENRERNNHWDYENEMEAKDMFETAQQSVCIAGGCLSEQFISSYKEKARDVDIFVELKQFRWEFSDGGHYYDEERPKPFEEILFESLKIKGDFGLRKRETLLHGYRDFLEIDSIISGYFFDAPDVPIEIILAEEIKIGFDLAFREFYYNGGNIIATTAAMEDIEEQKITINHINSPYSTLVRAKEFSNRYGFKRDEVSHSWLLKSLRYEMGGLTPKQVDQVIYELLQKVKKYKHNWESEKLANLICQESVSEEERNLLFELNRKYAENTVLAFRRLVKAQEIRKNEAALNEQAEWFPIERLKPNYGEWLVEQGENFDKNREISVEKVKEFLKGFEKLEQQQKLKEVFAGKEISVEMGERVMEKFIEQQKKTNLSAPFTNKDSATSILNLINNLKTDLIAETGNREIEFFGLGEMESYNGTSEQIKNAVLAQKVLIGPDWNFWIVNGSDAVGEQMVLFDVLFEGDSVEAKKSLLLNPSQKQSMFVGERFAFMKEDRADDLKKQLENEIKKLPLYESFSYENKKLCKFSKKRFVERKQMLKHEEMEEVRIHTEKRREMDEKSRRGEYVCSDDDLPF